MVDHTFLFTGAVKKIRQLMDEGALGDLYYYDSLRVNLGLFQHDVNVIWDLAPHDLSIMDHVIRDKPDAVVATGESHLNGIEDVAFITVYFPRARHRAHQRELAVASEGAHHLDRRRKENAGVERSRGRRKNQGLRQRRKHRQSTGGLHQLLVSYRSGDMWAPQVEQIEALRAETAYFLKCIRRRTRRPFNDGVAGLRVVRILEAADRSVRNRGEAVIPVNEFVCIAPDVKLGKDVKLSKFINMYGCEVGDETKIGAFVEIQKNATRGAALQDFQPHLYLRRRGHRRQRFHRPQRDIHQRCVSARDHCGRRAANRSRLEG